LLATVTKYVLECEPFLARGQTLSDLVAILTRESQLLRSIDTFIEEMYVGDRGIVYVALETGTQFLGATGVAVNKKLGAYVDIQGRVCTHWIPRRGRQWKLGRYMD
jgi:hypothetical protein